MWCDAGVVRLLQLHFSTMMVDGPCKLLSQYRRQPLHVDMLAYTNIIESHHCHIIIMATN